MNLVPKWTIIRVISYLMSLMRWENRRTFQLFLH